LAGCQQSFFATPKHSIARKWGRFGRYPCNNLKLKAAQAFEQIIKRMRVKI